MEPGARKALFISTSRFLKPRVVLATVTPPSTYIKSTQLEVLKHRIPFEVTQCPPLRPIAIVAEEEPSITYPGNYWFKVTEFVGCATPVSWDWEFDPSLAWLSDTTLLNVGDSVVVKVAHGEYTINVTAHPHAPADTGIALIRGVNVCTELQLRAPEEGGGGTDAAGGC
jgi:hypothetical protein